MKLTPNEIAFLRLVERSPDCGDGWRKVSKVLMSLAQAYTRPELIELVENGDGTGRCRFSEKGKIVAEYV